MIFIIRNPRRNHPKSISNRRIAVIEHPDINKEHINKALQEGQLIQETVKDKLKEDN